MDYHYKMLNYHLAGAGSKNWSGLRSIEEEHR